MVEQVQTRRYAVIDAAQDERLLPAINYMSPRARCLFDDPVDPELSAAAPWLVPLPAESEFLNYWRRHGRGKPWGFIFESPKPQDVLRRHLKKLLRAQLPDQRVVLFRFYDPRVLKVYLQSSDPGERSYFFGPMTRIFFEDEATGQPVTLDAAGVPIPG